MRDSRSFAIITAEANARNLAVVEDEDGRKLIRFKGNKIVGVCERKLGNDEVQEVELSFDFGTQKYSEAA